MKFNAKMSIFSGVLAGEFHRPALAEGHDQGPILHALVRHPADLLHEAQRLPKMRKHLGKYFFWISRVFCTILNLDFKIRENVPC